jgi:hypothetical protein
MSADKLPPHRGPHWLTSSIGFGFRWRTGVSVRPPEHVQGHGGMIHDCRELGGRRSTHVTLNRRFTSH